LQSNATYRLIGEKDGHFVGSSEVFTTKKRDTDTFVIHLILPKIEVGYQHRLEKFIFQVNDTTILEEGKPLLELIAKKLRENSELKVQIACHSDARGDDTYNLTLSQQRAEALKNYLIACGVKPHQLVAKGYGETQILNECKNGVRCPTEKHEENRKVIFEVLGWE
ncbi:MAG: OmpA family protein, partial [Flammeovirgaceae bacterium]|nr:OmpA family protein [Flammeovirgaceae bacterium]MDW8287881.1 OmpA family protein [Flammeovirgaceae bacterium]